jgi:hypothetical protein
MNDVKDEQQLEAIERTRQSWEQRLGEYFLVPSNQQLGTLLSRCCWDEAIVKQAMRDLLIRHCKAPFESWEDGYDFCVKQAGHASFAKRKLPKLRAEAAAKIGDLQP